MRKEEAKLRKRKVGGNRMEAQDDVKQEAEFLTQEDLLGVGGDLRDAVGGGRLRRGGGGSADRAVGPGVWGRRDDRGAEGGQDGGENIQVFAGRLPA